MHVLNGDDEITYAIHEAYYEDGTPVDGQPSSITEMPTHVWGNSLDEIRQTLAWFERALDKPVLNYEDF